MIIFAFEWTASKWKADGPAKDSYEKGPTAI